ncbi:hypothetical protein JAAARDRAFT_210106 [Jaapia argillacea MUCL 33604]|uniref:Uncharacterized protein n=1 Tax=Jaapia argillacea MUCL 33604 TaxID=933084 RepID=A0A067PE00_9AGAM|nr:hypothetical protein JAAARDRAFT_210106 [Jaapia argillacea MUCL 33604]
MLRLQTQRATVLLQRQTHSSQNFSPLSLTYEQLLSESKMSLSPASRPHSTVSSKLTDPSSQSRNSPSHAIVSSSSATVLISSNSRRFRYIEPKAWNLSLWSRHCALRRLSTTEVNTSKALRDLLTYIPHLEELKLNSDIRSWCNDPEDRESWQGIMKFLPTFSGFPNLRKLMLPLPDASSLDIGFDPPWWGNASMDSLDLDELVEREDREVSELVAKGVQTLCPVVSELWVGGTCFKRDDKGVMVCPDPWPGTE